MKREKTTYTIGVPNDEVEMNFMAIHHILKESKIHATFSNETFIKLKDGQLIKMFNKDITRYKQELRDHNLDNLLEE